MTLLSRQKRPCAECPFRRHYVVQAQLDAPMFACHKSPDGGEFACAGWLAVEGVNHIGVRVAVAMGRVPAEALRPGEEWPALFDSYEDMEAAQASAPSSILIPECLETNR